MEKKKPVPTVKLWSNSITLVVLLSALEFTIVAPEPKTPSASTSSRTKFKSLSGPVIPLKSNRSFTVPIVPVSSVESNTAEKLLAKNPTGYHQFILAGNDENFNWLTKVGRTDSGNIHIKGLSYFIDGGFGSKDALLKEKYADTDLIGTQFTDSSLINEISDLCASLRFQLTFHAYGDSGFSLAARQMGDALESVNDNRWRIEHNQFITAADYNLLKKFSILPSVQPTQAQTDKKQFATILGTQRNCETYNFKKLLNQNQFLASGSLYPIGELNPIEQLIALLNSENQCNHGIDKKAALKAITIWPAMLAFFDSETGSLEVGKNADFVVLNLDPVKAETKTLEQLKIETTHIKGIQKFSRN